MCQGSPYCHEQMRNRHIYWRLGGESNREIDFGFGCACVACVRACEAVCGREGRWVPRVRPKNLNFVVGPAGRPGPACPARPRWWLGNAEKKVSFFRNLIASGYSAKLAEHSCAIKVPNTIWLRRFLLIFRFCWFGAPARISPCRFGARARISPCRFGPAGRFSFDFQVFLQQLQTYLNLITMFLYVL